jgi:hypothetical protein
MADIDANIINIQQSLNNLLERVSKGEVLSTEEARTLLECRKGFDQLKQVDTYKEVMKGAKLKAITDKWA